METEEPRYVRARALSSGCSRASLPVLVLFCEQASEYDAVERVLRGEVATADRVNSVCEHWCLVDVRARERKIVRDVFERAERSVRREERAAHARDVATAVDVVAAADHPERTVANEPAVRPGRI